MQLRDIVSNQHGLRRRAAEAALAAQPAIEALSCDIHAHPEQMFEEWRSSASLVDFLQDAGFETRLGVGRLPTAFTATRGSGELTFAVVAEYDALPNGHACGHNLILGAALLAAIALGEVAEELGIRVKVIGTPAEEGGGGKLFLLQDGAFDDVHAALEIHAYPWGVDQNPEGSTCQAVARWQVTYSGKSAHAAGAPEQGINSQDAVVIAEVALGMLRQQIADGYRTNTAIRRGADKCNIIPDESVVDFEVRAPDLEAFWQLYARVENCFRAGAIATGCSYRVEQFEPVLEPMKNDPMLSRHWCEEFGAFGRDVSTKKQVFAPSTDFGNVSQVLPGIHPWVSIPGVHDALHSDGFRENAVTASAFETMAEGALAMALTVIETAQNPDDVAYLMEAKRIRRPIDMTPLCNAEHLGEHTPPAGWGA